MSETAAAVPPSTPATAEVTGEPTFRSVPAARELLDAGHALMLKKRIEQLEREMEEAVQRGDGLTAAAKREEAENLKAAKSQTAEVTPAPAVTPAIPVRKKSI